MPMNLDKAQAELVALYRAAGARLKDQLLGALTDFQRFRIGEQLKQVDAIVAALAALTPEASETAARAAYQTGTDLAATALKRQGVALEVLDLGNQIHTAGLQAVADQMSLDLIGAAQRMGTQAKDILRKTQQRVLEERRINEIVARGLVEGQTERQTTAEIARDLKARLGDGVRVQAGSKTFDPANYAELVVRTRTREAVTAGAINRGLEYGVTLYQISITSTACPECSAVQGKVYVLPGVVDARFPALTDDIRPPLHPRCSHVALPFVEVPGKEDETEALSRLSQSKAPLTDQAAYEVALAEARRK